jgi:SSS family solute:Na+ symporter
MLVKEKEAKKAWLIAGFFSGHMAFGCYLGMLAKVAATNGMFEGITSMDDAKWDYLFCDHSSNWANGLMLSSYFRLYFPLLTAA